MASRELANAYEAQIALEPYRKLLKTRGKPDLEDSQTQYYLGLFKYVVDRPEDKLAAKEMATRAIDRVILKVLKGKLPDDEVDRLLNVRSLCLLDALQSSAAAAMATDKVERQLCFASLHQCWLLNTQ